jgi:single-strand DNA-binding protein
MSIENDVRLIGNLGADPETKWTQAGTAVTKIRLATTSRRKDRDGNTQERTEWHRVVFFGKLAEIVGEHLRSGSGCVVTGSIHYDKYTGTDGVERYYTEIIGEHVRFIGARVGDQDAPQQSRRGTRPSENKPPERGAPPPDMDDFADDDIPF